MSTAKQLSKAEIPEKPANEEAHAPPKNDSGTPKKKGARPYVILAIVVGVGLAAYLAYRAFTAGKESTDDAQVSTDMVPLAVRVSGNVVELPVADNQAVKKGDVIAKIDPLDYQSLEKQAEAEVAGRRRKRTRRTRR